MIRALKEVFNDEEDRNRTMLTGHGSNAIGW